MSQEFELIEEAIGPVIEIEERVPMWRMPATFGRDYQRITDYLAEQGAECTGMPYAHYLEMDWEQELNRGKLAMFWSMISKKWHFFAGMPTSKLLPGEGELQSAELANRKYARAVHRGPYQQCGVTYKALYDWAISQGLLLQDEAIEFYMNDPREVAKAEIETVILIPVQV
jgi:effector-binding domain-containing protein